MLSKNIEVFAALGAGLSRGHDGQIIPSLDAQARLTVLAHDFIEAEGKPQIYVTGGRVFWPRVTRPLSEFSADYLTKVHGIDPNHITQIPSLETIGDINGVKRAMRKQNLVSARVYSNEWHLIAADRAGKAGFEFRSIEDWIREQGPEYGQLLSELTNNTSQLLASQQRLLNTLYRPGGELIYRAAAILSLPIRARIPNQPAYSLQEIIGKSSA